MRLKGKRALVTGAADGIGRLIASAFAAEGARVLIFDTDGAKGGQLAKELVSMGAEAASVQGSVAVSSDVEDALSKCDELFGGVDILVNNAGVTGNMPALDVTDEFWDRTISINLRGTFLCARAAGRRMIAQGHGVILNMASMYGVVAAPDRVAYCASKSAVCMMTKVLAIEWGGSGIRVNALAPGYVFTNSTAELVQRGRLDIDALCARTPLKRLAEPAEIAELAVFACSSASGYITGQILGIDGGWSAYGYI